MTMTAPAELRERHVTDHQADQPQGPPRLATVRAVESGWRRHCRGLAFAALISACRAEPALDGELAPRVIQTYAAIAFAGYDESLERARALERAIDALLDDPSETTLTTARRAWLRARVPYAQTEVFRFCDGPIDRVEFLINTWPIDEGYVEAEPGGEHKGIVDDPLRYPELNRELLVRLNGSEGETSISTGYHVLEFLLWGRDHSDVGPGERSFRDFVVAQDATATRRREYLRLATELLLMHLEQVRAEWDPAGRANYRARLEARPVKEALALVLKGMGTLSGPELAGERLTVPYETRDQENEHSCFSDSTQADLANDALGIQNVCLGRYVGGSAADTVRGVGVCTLLTRFDAKLGRRLEKEIAQSVRSVQAIPSPFDRALTAPDNDPRRVAIRRSIDALEQQARTLAEAAAALGLGATPVRAAVP